MRGRGQPGQRAAHGCFKRQCRKITGHSAVTLYLSLGPPGLMTRSVTYVPHLGLPFGAISVQEKTGKNKFELNASQRFIEIYRERRLSK